MSSKENNLMNEKFNAIKHQAYNTYQGFNAVFARSNNYQMDLSECVFKHGNCTYKILPVATASEYGAPRSLILFGDSHPTGFNYRQLDEVISQLKLPRYFEDTDFVSQEGATACFKQGFKISALICEAVQGKTFVSVCPQDGIWMWFVILKPTNTLAERMLSAVESRKSKIQVEEADRWYTQMKF